jgi:hypothetical protein
MSMTRRCGGSRRIQETPRRRKKVWAPTGKSLLVLFFRKELLAVGRLVGCDVFKPA